MTALFTIGYERDPGPAALAARLQAAGVTRLVDVRAVPRSRKPGFSKTGLAAALGEAGIAYDHAGALGNPRPIRDLYTGGRLDEGRRAYLAHLRGPASGAVDALLAGLDDAPTAVMCLEHDAAGCHRRELAAELAARRPGLVVRDL